MINPYLLAGAVGVGFFASKKLWEKGKKVFTPKLRGTYTVAEFKNKVNFLKEKYSFDKKSLKIIEVIEEMCQDMKDDEEISIG